MAFITGVRHVVSKPRGGRYKAKVRAVSTGDPGGSWTESDWSAPSNEVVVV